MTNKSLIIYLLLILLLIASCSGDKLNTEEVNVKYFSDSTLVASIPQNQMIQIGISAFGTEVSYTGKYGVDVYKINYKTTNVDGTPITASGAVIIPKGTDDELPILSYQHQTIHYQNESPSNYLSDEVKGLPTAFAGSGYAVVVPDYIGYGASSNYPHPYVHGASLASASIDMLKAAKEFFRLKGIAVNDQLFLTGYSEGGYATMALHEAIEESTSWKVTMSAPASGAYNGTASTLEVLQQNKDIPFLAEYMWIIDSYNWIYHLDKNWSQIVNSPYDSTLKAVTNPMRFGQSPISLNPTTLFRDSFADGIVNGSDTKVIHALNDNDRYNWSPLYPITLYYGTADDYVFPSHSISAYNALSSNGGDVTLVGFPGKDHFTAVPEYYKNVYTLFESLKQ